MLKDYKDSFKNDCNLKFLKVKEYEDKITALEEEKLEKQKEIDRLKSEKAKVEKKYLLKYILGKLQNGESIRWIFSKNW